MGVQNKHVTGEIVHRLKNADGFENVRWIDDNTIYLYLNDVPLMLSVDIDERYERLMDMEKSLYEMRDRLRNMNFHMTATEVDQLANDVSKLQLEL
jgi:hypothetical protein